MANGRADDQRPAQVRVLIGGEATGGRFALVETVERRGAEPPRHRHLREDEVLLVLAGEVRVSIGGAVVAAAAGIPVFVPRGSEHAVAVVGAEARLLSALLPAGFEGFYRELAGAPPGMDLDRLVATAARYGCEITGPPLDDDRD